MALCLISAEIDHYEYPDNRCCENLFLVVLRGNWHRPSRTYLETLFPFILPSLRVHGTINARSALFYSTVREMV